MPEFVPFGQFLAETEKAEPAEPVVASITGARADRADSAQALDRAEHEKMKQFILSLYERTQPVHGFQGPDGWPVDCIPIEQQPALRGLSKAEIQDRLSPPTYQGPDQPMAAPREGVAAPLGIDHPLGLTARDPSGNVMACPEGSVPIRRVNLEQLTRFGNLADFFRKSPGGGQLPGRGGGSRDLLSHGEGVHTGVAEPEVAEIHRYAHAAQNVGVCYGGGSWLNVWTPSVAPGVFSLSQQWWVGDNGHQPLQTLEGGWQVYPALYGHSGPVLFIFFTAAGYAPGSSGYNGYMMASGAGQQPTKVFVQQNNQWVIGGPFGRSSTRGGPQQGFRMQWQRNEQGDWWLFLQGSGNPEPIGYYPGSIYGNGPMASGADRIDFGGEVCAAQGSMGTGQMGSGQHAAEGFQSAAFQKQITFLGTGGQPSAATLTPDQPNPQCYTVAVTHDDPNWQSSLFFGGPGCS